MVPLSVRRAATASCAAWMGELFTKYSLVVAAAVVLLAATAGTVHVYSIVYMLFFCLLVVFMQVSWACFRRLLVVYWSVLLLYSTCVMVAVVAFQLDGVAQWWRRASGLGAELSRDVGLGTFTSAELAVRLLAAFAVWLALFVQLYFFHARWIKLTCHAEAREQGRTRLENSFTRRGTAPRKLTAWQRVNRFRHAAVEVLWRLADIHSRKVVLCVFILICAFDPCALNWPLVVVVSASLLFPGVSYCVYILSAIYLTLLIGARMVFQLEFVHNDTLRAPLAHNFALSCKHLSANETVIESNVAPWLGLEKTDSLFSYLFGYLAGLAVIASQVAVAARQRYHEECWRGEQTDGLPRARARGVVFHAVSRGDADRDCRHCLQYLINYVFYKLGVELSFLCAVVVIALRMDGVALLYSTLLLVMVGTLMVSRSLLARLWHVYAAVLAVLLPLQYAVIVGLPRVGWLCYPWQPLLDRSWGQNLVMWLNLSDYERPPRAALLVADFAQVLCVSLQLIVFRTETAVGAQYAGGSNAPIFQGAHLVSGNPVADFIAQKRTALDVVKHGVFMYSPWLTLAIVLTTGLGASSIFALGYLLAAFVLLWRGNNLYLQPMRHATRCWRVLIIYTVLIIGLKVVVQMVGCVFIESIQDDYCSAVKLFSIICVNERAAPLPSNSRIWLHDQASTRAALEQCVVRRDDAYIRYDAFCFFALLIQLRIICSWYFQHVVLEYRAERVLSSRGAVLIHQLVRKEIKEQSDAEKDKFREIRTRTEKIRRWNRRERVDGRRPKDPQNYVDAKRAGDYYMFADSFRASAASSVDESAACERSPGQSPFGPAQRLHSWLNESDELATARGALSANGASYTHSSSDELVEPAFVEPSVTEELAPSVSAPLGTRLMSLCELLRSMLEAAIDSCSLFFNGRSRNHRYVAYVLAEEKRRLKNSQRKELEMPTRSLRQMRRDVAYGELALTIHCVRRECDIDRLENEAVEQLLARNVLVRFLTALGYLLLSNTKLLCFLLMFANQTFTAAIISLPFPLLALLWGTLCSPRPPKLFWIVAIAYTELVIIVKFVFRFGLFTWNADEDTNASPFYAPRIIGVERESRYAVLDVALLISLFFHRYMLRTWGLWKNPLERPASLVGDEDSDSTVMSPSTATAVTTVTTGESRYPTGSEIFSNGSTESGRSSGPAVVEMAREAGRHPALTYVGSLARFVRSVLHPDERRAHDLYVFVFLCDVVCFILIVANYSMFGASGSGDFYSDLQQNTVSVSFVLYLLVLAGLMVVDRALYLRKSVRWKLCLQLVLVAVVHAWVFFLLPLGTGVSTQSNGAVQLWYFIKCIYLLFSATQIRNGYPAYTLGNLLTRSYNVVCFVLFKCFMFIPFMWELRTAIDWTWTQTSLPLFDYFRMESFYAIAYHLKCMRKLEHDFPDERGKAKKKLSKHIMGLPLVVLLIMVIWSPLIIFALLNQIGQALPPEHVQFSIAIQGYPTLYEMEAQGDDLLRLNGNGTTLDRLHSKFGSSSDKFFFERYEAGGGMVQRVVMRPQSNTVWQISPPAERALQRDLNQSESNMYMAFSWTFRRPRVNGSTDEVALSHRGENVIVLDPPKTSGARVRTQLDAALNSKDARSPSVTVYNAFPAYVVVPNGGAVRDAPILDTLARKLGLASVARTYTSVNLTLVHEDAARYWEVTIWQRRGNGSGPDDFLLAPAVSFVGDYTALQMVAFVDRVFPTILNRFVSSGIIAMYIAVVYVASSISRAFFLKSPMDVQTAELPDAEPLMSMCHDIYLVREAKDFRLEQDLFARIIFLFRSPETLIKWSRKPPH